MRYHYSGLGFQLLLLIAGIAWCVQAWQRLPGDMANVRRSKDALTRRLVVGYWVATGLILAGLMEFGPGVVVRFVHLLRW